MIDFISDSIVSRLLIQSVSAIPLFLFALLFSILFHYKYPRVEYTLWLIFAVRLIVPIDYLYSHFFPLSHSITMITIPDLPDIPSDLFFISSQQIKTVHSGLNWKHLLFYIWVAGSIFFILRYIFVHNRIHHIHKMSLKVEAASHQRRLEIWRKRLGIKRSIQLRYSSKTRSAFNLGILRPVIILPIAYRNLSLAKLDIIIGHECVHIKRYDNAQLMLQYFIGSFYFFNPMIWLSNRYLQLSREQICDTTVIQKSNVPGFYYGNVLLDSLFQPGITGIYSGFNLQQYLIKQRLLTLNRSRSMNRISFILIILSSLALSGFSLDNKGSGTTTQKNVEPKNEFTQPIRQGRISSVFGERMHPILKIKKMHNGIDIAAPTGTPIYAAADGLISFAEKKGGYGKLIIIEHADGFRTLYGQLSEIKVARHDQVQQGQLIGLVGSSGMSTAPHLHFEIRQNDKPLNPQDFIEFIF